jgi:hypothetical protein
MKRTLVAAAACLIAAATMYLTLPPNAVRLSAETVQGVRGAIHVHSRRSDGSGTPEQIAAAASRAGLQFVILTDHGDGMRSPAPPKYHSGVLVIDAVEVSSNDGHVVALGLEKTPYPLGGDARDVIEDVARLGGMSIAAHPGSPKRQLAWTEWSAPFDGIEWLNGDSESRDESWLTHARVLLTYPFRSTAVLASMLDRPDTILRRWDELASRRRVVALAASDAHARLDLTGEESAGGLGSVRIPGYEVMFTAFSVTATGVTFVRDAGRDAASLLDALTSGRLYSSVDALATPAAVSFRAARGDQSWDMGEFVPPGEQGIELRVESNAPPGTRIVLFKDGEVAAEGSGSSWHHMVPGTRAVYRVEIRADAAPGTPPVPWVVTNPIYVRDQDEMPRARGDAAERMSLYDDGEAGGWRIEKSERSKAALDVVRTVTGTELLLRWALGGTVSDAPYVALAMPAGQGLPAYDRLTFSARADQPTRLSVQFRAENGERWRRSVYLDEQPRQVSVFLDETRPADATAQGALPVTAVRDVLFVVDTVNARPGAAGRVWIDDVQYAR